MSVGHIDFIPIDGTSQKAGGAVVKERNSLYNWEAFIGIRNALNRLVLNKVSISCFGIKVIMIW